MNRRDTLGLALAVLFLGAATAACGPTPLADAPAARPAALTGAGGLAFYPLAAPLRLLDTRAGQPAVYAPGTRLTSASSSYTYNAAGVGGIPQAAQALVLRVTLRNFRAQICTYDEIWRDVYCGGWSTQNDYAVYPRVDLMAHPADRYTSDRRFVQVGSGPQRPTEQLVTVPLSSTGALSLAVESGHRLPQDPYYESRSYDYIGRAEVDATIDVVGYYGAPGQPGALYLHLLDTQHNLVNTCAGYCWPIAPIALGAPVPGGTPVTINVHGTHTRGDQSGTFTLPTSARWLLGSLTTRDTAAHAGQTTLTNVYAAGAARPDTGLAITNVGSEAAQFLVPLSPSGALVLQADVRSDIALDVAGYFSAVAGDDGNGPGLLWNPFVRQGIAASGEIYETEFASLLVRGAGLLPPEARAMSGRILYAAGGESDGSQISVSPTGLYAGSWGTDVRGTGYPDTVDEATFVRRLGPGGALDVGPGSPDLTYARATLDAFGYYVAPGL